jgi:hypothetical protein
MALTGYWAIAGYTFEDKRICTDHILGHVQGNSVFNSDNRRTTELLLDDLAKERGIDREDEHSFDSADFPKLIVQAQAHRECSPEECRDRCASSQCGESLGGECPQAEPEEIHWRGEPPERRDRI